MHSARRRLTFETPCEFQYRTNKNGNQALRVLGRAPTSIITAVDPIYILMEGCTNTYKTKKDVCLFGTSGYGMTGLVVAPPNSLSFRFFTVWGKGEQRRKGGRGQV